MLAALSFLICILLNSVDSKHEIYKGSKVYTLKFSTAEQQARLSEIKNDRIDFWRKPNYKYNVEGLALVPHAELDWFEDKLAKIRVHKDVFIQDVYEYLVKRDLDSSSRNIASRSFGYDSYHRYDEILQYLNEKAQNSSFVEVIQYGSTSQGRPLSYIKISSTPNIVKPINIIEAGIIPREWITISAAVNIVDHLLDNDEGLVDAFDWIIIPVVNPDGYEYTHTDLRFWSKTLTTSSNLGDIFPGVNINRNFDVDFQNFDSSSSPCSHLYSGPEPYSEIESRFIRDLVLDHQENIRLYVSLQNSGGFLAYPWSYENAASGMFIQQHRLGYAMIEAMNSTGYSVGSSSVVVGDRASGTSSDFVQRSGVLYSLTLDVKSGSGPDILVPEEEIRGVVEDVWRAVAVAARSFV